MLNIHFEDAENSVDNSNLYVILPCSILYVHKSSKTSANWNSFDFAFWKVKQILTLICVARHAFDMMKRGWTYPKMNIVDAFVRGQNMENKENEAHTEHPPTDRISNDELTILRKSDR